MNSDKKIPTSKIDIRVDIYISTNPSTYQSIKLSTTNLP